MARIPTGQYRGRAEILVDGNKLTDVTIDIHGSAAAVGEGNLAGPEAPVRGSDRWDGRIVPSGDYDLYTLFVELLRKVFTLRTPDGRETTAFLRDDRGTLAASSPFPFDM